MRPTLMFLGFTCALSISALAQSELLRLAPVPTPQNTNADAATLVQDYDRLMAQDAVIAVDRGIMFATLTSNGNLDDAVRQFFRARDLAASIDLDLFNDRVNLRRDIGFVPARLISPIKAQGLNADASRYIQDFDTRNTKDAAVKNDIQGMRTALAQSNSALVTSNANAFFNDRHALAQARANEGGDIAALRKDLKFHGTGSVNKPARTDLAGHVHQYMIDRQKWLDDGVRVEADRNNMRATLNSSSLQDVVQTFLTDHHQLALDEQQLTLDRNIMRLNIGFKVVRLGQNFFGSLIGHSLKKEDLLELEDIDQDVSADNVGEK